MRRNREEKERKNRRLSSWKRTKESRLETENAGSENGVQAPVERLWERSREERKETNSRAEYRNLEGRHERLGRREGGNRGSESGGGHRESSCEAEPGRGGKEEQRLSSQNPKLRRTKECRNSGGQKAKRKR